MLINYKVFPFIIFNLILKKSIYFPMNWQLNDPACISDVISDVDSITNADRLELLTNIAVYSLSLALILQNLLELT